MNRSIIIFAIIFSTFSASLYAQESAIADAINNLADSSLLQQEFQFYTI